MEKLMIGILIGIIVERYLFQYLDVVFTLFRTEQNVTINERQLDMEISNREFELKYNSDKNEFNTSAIGFHPCDSHIDEDDIDEVG